MKKICLVLLCFFWITEARSDCPLALVLMQKNRPDVAIKEFANCGELNGDIISLYQVGTMLYNGELVKKDLEQSARYYRLAANMGYAPAQLKLGMAYWKGEGVKQDLKKAYTWIFLAAEDASKRWYYPLSVAFDQNLSLDAASGASEAISKMEAYFKGKNNTEIINLAKQDANSWKYRRLQEFAKKVLGDEYDAFAKNLKTNAKDNVVVAKILADLKSRAKGAGVIK